MSGKSKKVEAAGRGPFLFPTYLGRSKGLCSRGMFVWIVVSNMFGVLMRTTLAQPLVAACCLVTTWCRHSHSGPGYASSMANEEAAFVDVSEIGEIKTEET